MTNLPQPVLQDRGEAAKELLSAPGTVTGAEALALAVLCGEIPTPSTSRIGD